MRYETNIWEYELSKRLISIEISVPRGTDSKQGSDYIAVFLS